jgi:signal transduction histidine kinase
VVRNLVSNAIKFTPRKGTVRLEMTREGKEVRFTVSDTGIGMSPEVVASLDQFGQLDSSPGTDHEIGTGLGLQLAKDLVEKSGGKLKIESNPGIGSTFTFTLPINP